MDPEDLRTALRVREGHEKELAEAAFAEELGGEPVHVVRRGQDEHFPLAVLHRREERSQDPERNAAPLPFPGRPGECLFDLVDPEDHG